MPELKSSPFAQLPPLMHQVLNRDESTDFNIEIVEKHKLNDKQRWAMINIIRSVIFQTIKPDQVPVRVAADLNLAGDSAKAVARDLLGLRFLPMEWYVGSVRHAITQLGGDLQEYLRRVEPIYPEVFNPGTNAPAAPPKPGHLSAAGTSLLNDFDKHLESNHGRAEVLLRLTGIAGMIDDRMKAGTMPKNEAESHLQQLDALSFAINNHDLNPFEVQALKRKLRRVLEAVGE